jgi:hypothetical protein
VDIPSSFGEVQQFLSDLFQRVALLEAEGEEDPWPDAVQATLNDPRRTPLGVEALHILVDKLVLIGTLVEGSVVRNLASRGFTTATVNAIIAVTLGWQRQGLRRLVFEPQGSVDNLANSIRDQLEEQLFPWISKVVELEEVLARSDESVLLVEIRYRLLESGERHTFVLSTDLSR